jgi:hypothetical protein
MIYLLKPFLCYVDPILPTAADVSWSSTIQQSTGSFSLLEAAGR